MNEIEELTKTNRSFIHDYLFTINPPDDEKIVDIRIDLTESTNTLKDSFEKLVASLRKELNIKNRKDSVLVNQNGPYIGVSNAILKQFIKYRVFEFFDLTFWTMLSCKRYKRETIADILFNDKKAEARLDLLRTTKDLVKKYINFNGEGFKSIESQAKSYLKHMAFSIKNK